LVGGGAAGPDAVRAAVGALTGRVLEVIEGRAFEGTPARALLVYARHTHGAAPQSRCPCLPFRACPMGLPLHARHTHGVTPSLARQGRTRCGTRGWRRRQ
jgi:hypothetical protein